MDHSPSVCAAMIDQIIRGQEFEKKTIDWGLSEDAAVKFYCRAANSYKISKSWEQAATAYNKLADCLLKMDSKHEAAICYMEAADCSKKISPNRKQTNFWGTVSEAISSLEQAVELLSELGRFKMAARCCKEAGELCEQGRNLEQAIVYFERAAPFFEGEQVTTSAIQCRQKVALLSARQQRYTKAAEIFEDIAWDSLHNNLLRYAFRGHLLNAGVCHLCKEDSTVAIKNALQRYKDMDPSFSRTREYQLLADLVGAVEEKNLENFTDILKEYDSLSPLDAWKTTMLLRVKEALKAN